MDKAITLFKNECVVRGLSPDDYVIHIVGQFAIIKKEMSVLGLVFIGDTSSTFTMIYQITQALKGEE